MTGLVSWKGKRQAPRVALWLLAFVAALALIGVAVQNVLAESVCPGAVGDGVGAIDSFSTNRSGGSGGFSNDGGTGESFYFGWVAEDQFGTPIYEGDSGWLPGSDNGIPILGGSFSTPVPPGVAFYSIDVNMFTYTKAQGVKETGAGSAGCDVAVLFGRRPLLPLRLAT